MSVNKVTTVWMCMHGHLSLVIPRSSFAFLKEEDMENIGVKTITGDSHTHIKSATTITFL